MKYLRRDPGKAQQSRPGFKRTWNDSNKSAVFDLQQPETACNYFRFKDLVLVCASGVNAVSLSSC